MTLTVAPLLLLLLFVVPALPLLICFGRESFPFWIPRFLYHLRLAVDALFVV
jgi:hypothetical protein